MTLAYFNALVATMSARWRFVVASAAYALGAAIANGEDEALAVARISGDPRYAPALLASGQMANFQSIADPLPVLKALSPESFVLGSPNTAVHCIGSGFTNDSVVNFAAEANRTDFHSPDDISTGIYAALWAGPAVVDVYVVGPGGQSETLPFTFLA